MSDVEKQARTLGWVPQEEFKGNPDHWVDAEEFVARGEQLMPLLRQNNRRLKDELLTRDQQLDTLKAQLDGATAAIQKLEKHYTEANKRAVETAKTQLKEQLKAARENGNVDDEFEILEKLDGIRQAEKEIETPPAKKDEPKPKDQEDPNGHLSQDFVAWKKENTWFEKDKQKTKEVVRIAEDLREEGTDLSGKAFMDECVRIYNERHGETEEEEEQEEEEKPKKNRPASKVESSTSRGTSSSSKSFASLPKEAKQACWEDADDLVGENKRYKTLKDWENAYAKIYHGE